MSIQPQGEDLRNAVKWISEERQENPQADLKKLIQKACLKFDLSPREAIYLEELLTRNSTHAPHSHPPRYSGE
jgi:hypothetical protein